MIERDKKGRFVKGSSGFCKNHSENTKIQISNSKKGKPSWNTGRSWSEQERIKLSLAKTKEKEFTGFKQIINRRIRMTKKYLKWRSAVFKRDNYHCQECGEKGYLEAHHIISFAKILRIYNIKTLEQAEKCEVLWDVGNGITYCRGCHIKLDGYIGGKLKSEIQH